MNPLKGNPGIHILQPWCLILPLVAFAKEKEFEAAIKLIPENWHPPGKYVKSTTNKNGTFEIWMGTLDDPEMKQLFARIQIFVLFFIEGGRINIAQEDGDRWTVFLLYEKQPVVEDPSKHQYVFAGFSTVYRFFNFQLPTPTSSPSKGLANWELPTGETPFTEMPCRTRISQFLVLPPSRGKGCGSFLYATIYDHYLNDPWVKEITVEDPNEAFDDLRDVCDLAFLETVPEFRDIRLNTATVIPKDKTAPVPKDIVDREKLEALRQKYKIAPRQFARLLEMHLMSKLPASVRPSIPDESEAPPPKATPADTYQYRLWTLLTKQRIYVQNMMLLGELAREERVEKLEETLRSVELEYARILALFERRTKAKLLNGAGPSPSGNDGKRKASDEWDGVSPQPDKRARLDAA